VVKANGVFHSAFSHNATENSNGLFGFVFSGTFRGRSIAVIVVVWSGFVVVVLFAARLSRPSNDDYGV